MKELYLTQAEKAFSVYIRKCLFVIPIIALMLGSLNSNAQCTGGSCDFTISSNTSYAIPAGQTYCLQKNNYNGTITFGTGSTLCIGSGITWNSASLTFTGASGTINNYGSSNKTFTLPSGYAFNNQLGGTYSGTLTQSNGSTATNAGTFSGGLTQSGGTFTNSVGGTLSGASTISGTLTNNGSITQTITMTATGSLTNNSSIAANIGAMPSGASFINSSAATYSGVITSSAGSTITDSGTLTNTTGTIAGTFTTVAGSSTTNGGTISQTFTLNGTLTNSGTLTNGLTIANGATATNSGTISSTVTINNGGTFNSNHNLAVSVVMAAGSTFANTTVYSGTLTNTGGAITNSGTISNTFTLNGTLSNSSTGTLTNGLTIANGATATNGGAIGSTISISNGGTLTNNHALAGNITMAVGSTFSNYSTYTGALTQNGGAIINYSGAAFTPSGTTLSGGSFTNNSGATITLPNATTTLASGYTLTNNGTLNESNTLVVRSGATLYLDGTQSMSAGTLADSGTTYLAGGLTVSKLLGNGSLYETKAGCNTLTVTTNTFSGTLDGGQTLYTAGLIVNVASSGSPTMTNGASATLTAPTQQPTGLSLGLSALTVTGTFSSPSPGTNISGYIVLRYIGLAAPSDNPTSYTYYPVGTAIGSSTVVALISGGAGSKSFTDTIPASGCSKNAYYRIFSYNGAGECESFYLTSPLTGSKAMPTAPTAAISPAGPSTFCVTGTLTASGGGSYLWNATGGSATTAAITTTASGTYIITVTNASGCTATASNVVTVDPTLTGSASATAEGYYNANDATATMTPSGGTSAYSYIWSNGATTQTAIDLIAGTYTVTMTDALSCSVTASATVTQPALSSYGDIDPVSSNIQTAPIGSYVIAMDSANQSVGGYFNIKAYGLIVTLLNNKIAMNWVIKSGKSKDSADFSASAKLVMPSTGTTTTKNFKAGPFVIFPQDTINGNIFTIVNTFNAANPSAKVNVYQLTAATTVDVRYVMDRIPKAAILNDGGNASIHSNYMTLASVPATNYSVLTSAVYIVDSCYNFASEPHNSTPETAVLDSLRSFVNAGGNVLFQCHAIWNYEDSAFFQTTSGIIIENTNLSPLSYGHPDLSFQQYEGGFDPNAIGGSVCNWELSTGGALVNNTQVFQSGTGANSNIVGQTQAKLGSGVGHLVFYTGGHDYGSTTNVNQINGMRSYFNAMLTPCKAISQCTSLLWDNDLTISETMSGCNLYKSQKDTFVIVVTNNGPSTTAATGVTVNNVFPASLTYVSSTASQGSYNSATGVWTVGSMNIGDSDTLTVIRNANASGAFSNSVYLTRNKYDFYQSNDTATLSGTIYNCSASAGSDISHCNDSVFTMAANTPCSGTGTWALISGTATIVSTSSSTSTVYVSPGNNATLTWTNISGCAYSVDTIVLNDYTLPIPAITPTGSTTLCAGGSVILTASGGTSYKWSTSATTAAITVNPGTTTTYTVTVTNANNCTASTSQVVTVNPVATITSQTSTYCSGIAFSYTPTGTIPASTTYAWAAPTQGSGLSGGTSGTGVSTVTSTLTNTTAAAVTATYIVTPSSPGTCPGSAFTVAVTISPIASIASQSTTYCSGLAFSYTPTGTIPTGTTYAWAAPTLGSGLTGGASGTGISSVTSTLTNTTAAAVTATYSVTPTSGSCTNGTVFTLTVTINPIATIASQTTSYCSGIAFSYTPTGTIIPSGTTYAWAAPTKGAGLTGGASGTGISTLTSTLTNTTAAAVTATYSVTPTSGACTNGSLFTVTVTINPIASITSQSTSYCSGIAFSYTPTGTIIPAGTSYAWAAPTLGSGLTGGASGTGISTVTSTLSNTTAAAVTATYSVTPTSGACSNGNIFTLTVTINPVATIVSQSTSYCSGIAFSYTPTGTIPAGTTYAWSAPTKGAGLTGGASGTGISTVTSTLTNTTAAAVTATYSVTPTSGACTNGSIFTVTVTINPIAAIASQSTSYCSGIAFSYTPTGTVPAGTTYAWAAPTKGAGLTGGASGTGISTVTSTLTNTTAAAVTATYSVTPTSGACTNGSIFTVTVTINPVAAIVSQSTSYCTGTAFSYTPTGTIPTGTTYAWATPTLGSGLTGGASGTGGGTVTSTLTNTTTAAVTATFSVTPTSGTCTNGSIFTVTVTVQGSLSATIAPISTRCAGTSITVLATPNPAGTYTYSWSGPSSFTASGASFTITSASTSNSGTYTVTMTASNSCNTTKSTALSVVNCVNLSGAILDDANGNGIIDSGELTTSNGQALYSILADTNGLVLATGSIGSNGSFSMSKIFPSTAGMTLRISTTQPTIGSTVSAALWPANWLGTMGQYGTNNAGGTGLVNNSGGPIPVATATSDITGMMIGFDRVQSYTTQTYTIFRPPVNSVKTLDYAAGLGDIAWTDPEDGVNSGSFVVLDISAMNNNILFYDSNNNNIVDASETITGYRVISKFDHHRLKMKFVSLGTTSATFSFAYIDYAGKTNPTPSTYTVEWTGGALPVKMEYFKAEKDGDHSSLLSWATATETDNAYFDVERSIDATTWESLGQVKGAGNSIQEQLYSFIDANPLNGVNYYRLKQVDVDGNYTYTNIEEVTFDNKAPSESTTLSIYPNPLTTSGSLTIEMSNSETKISNVTIYNTLGQVVYSGMGSQTNVLQLDNLGFAAGVYSVSVYTTQSDKPHTSLLVIK